MVVMLFYLLYKLQCTIQSDIYNIHVPLSHPSQIKGNICIYVTYCTDSKINGIYTPVAVCVSRLALVLTRYLRYYPCVYLVNLRYVTLNRSAHYLQKSSDFCSDNYTVILFY